MAKNIGYMFVDGKLTLVLHGNPYDVDPKHPQYKNIVSQISRPEGETEEQELTRANALLQMVKADDLDVRGFAAVVGFNDVKVEHGVVTVKGRELRNSLTQRIIELKAAGLPFDSFIRFLVNLEANPSEESREALFDFLEQGRFPLTDDGCFLGYKGVIQWELNGKMTLVDQHTKSFDMSPGNIHEMPWDAVDNNRGEACGAGFHVGTIGHARGFGAHMIVVKVNPKDCVSVPKYDTTKLRCCRYEVVNVFNEGATAKAFARPVLTEEEYRSESFEEEDKEYAEEMAEPEEDKALTRRQELEAMNRDDICRLGAAEGIFTSTNEARGLGKEIVVEAMLCGSLPFDIMNREQLAWVATRRHLFASEASALKAGREAIVAALVNSPHLIRI